MKFDTVAAMCGAALLTSFAALGCACWAVRERARARHYQRVARHLAVVAAWARLLGQGRSPRSTYIDLLRPAGPGPRRDGAGR